MSREKELIKHIENELIGIAEEDLTKAEKNILRCIEIYGFRTKRQQKEGGQMDLFKEWVKRHHWHCLLWQIRNGREPNDYDGVCYQCKKDRHMTKNLSEFIKKIGLTP